MPKLSSLDVKHPDYTENIDTWTDISLLYRAGPKLKANASRFVRRRLAEADRMYRERLEGFTYQNVLAAGLGWYTGKLFLEPPEISFDPPDEFLTAFLTNCDRNGKNFTELLRSVAEDLLCYGRSWVLTDTPGAGGRQFSNLGEQVAAGVFDPYLVHYSPLDVINWSMGPDGLEWAIAKTCEPVTEFLGKPGRIRHRWYYFDRQRYRTFEHIADPNEVGSNDDPEVEEVASGEHALAHVNRVPLRMIRVLDALWLATNCYLLASERCSHENALAWGLTQSCLAMLVVYTNEDPTIIRAETSWIKLAPGDKAEYLEQSGSSLRLMEEKIANLREEIYRALYLVVQGRNSETQHVTQSGVAKEADMSSSTDTLQALGDCLLPAARSILADVIDARKQIGVNAAPEVTIRGFDFDGDLSVEDVELSQRVLHMNIPSDTLTKFVQKRAARLVIGDDSPEVLDEVEKEIDAAPTADELKEQEFEREMEMRTARIGGVMPPKPKGRKNGPNK